MIKEDGTVVFEGKEQEELDRIVGERLAREKGKYADYEDVKGIAEELKAFGYEGTPAEIRTVIKQQREEAQRQQELQELQKQAKEEGTSPELLQEIKELKKELSEIKGERQASKQAEEQKKKADEDWNKQVKAMTEKHPDVDLDVLAEDAKFKKFIKGKNLPLLELYDDFQDFVGETEIEVTKKTVSKQIRSTSAGSGQGKDSYAGLTDEQKTTVDDWNRNNPTMQMSYKEFAQRL